MYNTLERHNCGVAAFRELKLNLHNFNFLDTLHSQNYVLSDFNSELTPEKVKIQVTFMIRKSLPMLYHKYQTFQISCFIKIIQIITHDNPFYCIVTWF